MPLRRKLLLSMVLPALLLGLVGVVGIASLRHLRTVAGTILSDNYATIQDARRMERALRVLQTLPPELAQQEDAALRQSLVDEFESAMGRCDQNVTETGEADILDRIHAGWEVAGPQYLSAAADHSERGVQHHEVVSTLHEDIGALVALNEQSMFDIESGTRERATMMIVAVGGSLGIAVLALAVFAVASANRISGPVVRTADRLHQALNPGPGHDHHPDLGVDEISRLQTELDALLERLRQYEDEQARKLDHLQGQLAIVMNQVLEGLALLDADLHLVEVNSVASVILDWSPGKSVHLGDLEARDDVREILTPIIEGSFQAERDLGELRFELDDEERIYRPRVLPIPASGDANEGYLLLFWDVTEQRRFEETKQQLISMLSHQLKTPMTSLSMSVNLIQEKMGDVSPEQAELIAIARQDCASLTNLISDLIDAARDVTPDLAVRPRRIDLARLLRAALRPLAPQAAEKGVTLVLPGRESGLPLNVDPVKFPWVITNLVGNALRYTDAGGRIEVAMEPVDHELVVSVSDTGAGIAEENLSRIFQPYVTLDAEPRSGTHGLGLAIAREIVEAHGGRIDAESAPGAGTTFRVRLPFPRGERS